MDKLIIFETDRSQQVLKAVAIATGILLALKLVQRYGRGPTRGTDNLKRLDGKHVAITGQ